MYLLNLAMKTQRRFRNRVMLRFRASDRKNRIAFLLFLILLCCFTYFNHETGGWNENARLLTTYSILEKHVINIDPYVDQTKDTVEINSHIYGDKAPGTAMLALIPMGVYWAVMKSFRKENPSFLAFQIISRWTLSSLPAALMGVAVYWVALSLGVSEAAAIFAAIGFGLASPIWPFATFLFSHILATTFTFFAFALALRIRRLNSCAPLPRAAIELGLCAGLAFATEYTTPPACILIIAIAYSRMRWKNMLRPVAATLLGLLPGLFLVSLHNFLLSGSPFTLPYTYHQNDRWAEMSNGFFGLSYPKFWVLWEITFGKARGLFLISPIFTIAIVGLMSLIRERATRAVGVWSVLIVVYFFAMNASYYYWDGGSSLGPRHCIPALPFLALGLAAAFDACKRTRWLSIAFLSLLVFSILVQIFFVSERPLPSFGTVIVQFLDVMNLFVHGEVHSQNAGNLLGLTEIWSLLPLALICVFLGRLIYKSQRDPVFSK